jgi:hypothetical protein
LVPSLIGLEVGTSSIHPVIAFIDQWCIIFWASLRGGVPLWWLRMKVLRLQPCGANESMFFIKIVGWSFGTLFASLMQGWGGHRQLQVELSFLLCCVFDSWSVSYCFTTCIVISFRTLLI